MVDGGDVSVMNAVIDDGIGGSDVMSGMMTMVAVMVV